MALVVLCLLVGCGSPGESAAPTDSPGDASSAEATEATEVATTPPIEPSPVAEVQPQPLKPRVEKRFTLDSPDWLGVGAGSLWVKLDVGLLTRIDPMTNAIVKHIKVAPRGAELCQGLSVVDDVIWTCGGDGGVVRVDPATNKVVARLPLGKATDQGTIPIVAGHAWFLIGDGSELYGVNNDTNEVDVKIPLDTAVWNSPLTTSPCGPCA